MQVYKGSERMEKSNNNQTYWILVVDDDVSNLKMANHILAGESMRVSCLKSGMDSCQHMLFAVEEGSTGEALLKSLKYRYVVFPTQKKAVEGASQKECDAAVIDIVMASCYTGEGHEFENLTCGVCLNDEMICIGFRNDSDITAEVEAFLKEAYQNGTIQKLSRKYGIENAVLTGEYTQE